MGRLRIRPIIRKWDMPEVMGRTQTRCREDMDRTQTRCSNLQEDMERHHQAQEVIPRQRPAAILAAQFLQVGR